MVIKARGSIRPQTPVHEIIGTLLRQRDIFDIDSFMEPAQPWLASLMDFGYTNEIETAVSLVKKARESGKTIIVYTDYDADGITGGTILWETLHLLGCKAIPYVPHRQHEGYGFSIKGIDAILENHDPALVISVDHGITAIEQVKYLKEKGIAVIITDHHLKQAAIPESADTIFHIPQLSGAGVAYYFAKTLFERLDPENVTLESHFKTDYVAIASIGAVADLVPLVGPTRSLVKYGLGCLSTMPRIGIKTLREESGIDGRSLTPFDIGFIIAPRINAIGRLEHALDALRLLCTGKEAKARELTQKLKSMNDSRKGLVDKAVKQAKAMVAALDTIPRVLVVRSDEWHEGIIGLIASKLADEYYRPTIILTGSEDNLKASCRSPKTINLMTLLTNWKDHFITFGGHQQAAGFSIPKTGWDTFLSTINATADQLVPEEQLIRQLDVDLEMPLSLATLPLVERLDKLQPFGMGNPSPSFVSTGIISDTRRMGKDMNHLKLFLKDGIGGGRPLEIVAFNRGSDFEHLRIGQTILCAYSLEINEWNGRRSVQGKLLHWQEAEHTV